MGTSGIIGFQAKGDGEVLVQTRNQCTSGTELDLQPVKVFRVGTIRTENLPATVALGNESASNVAGRAVCEGLLPVLRVRVMSAYVTIRTVRCMFHSVDIPLDSRPQPFLTIRHHYRAQSYLQVDSSRFHLVRLANLMR